MINILNFTVFNIREYLQDSEIGEADLIQLLSYFFYSLDTTRLMY